MNCSWCSEPMRAPAGTGRPPKYHDACKAKARAFVDKVRRAALDTPPPSRASRCVVCNAPLVNAASGRLRKYCDSHKPRAVSAAILALDYGRFGPNASLPDDDDDRPY